MPNRNNNKIKAKHKINLLESATADTKQCVDCQEVKLLTEFRLDKRIRGGRKTHCITCQRQREREYVYRYNRKYLGRANEAARRWRTANPEKHRASVRKSHEKRNQITPDEVYATRRAWRLFNTYGISESEYQAMATQQNHVCAICKQPERKHQRGLLHVDHCHQTNLVRGLLCGKCNQALGGVNDNIEILNAMIDYLQFYHRNVA